MKAVRGRADARWLPSRRAFAFFRLIAFVRLWAAKPEPANVTLMVHHYQDAFESYAVSFWYLFTTAAFITAALPWRLPVAIAAAIPLSIIAIEIPLYISGLLLAPVFVRGENRQRFNSAAQMLMLLGWAPYFARQDSWARFAGWQAIVVVAVNVLCSALVFLLRGRIAKLEERLTCES